MTPSPSKTRVLVTTLSEVAVVAHDGRPMVLDEEVLEEVERLGVEVVRRLVHDEDVRGLREEPGEEEPVALAAREHPRRGAGAVGGEEGGGGS